MFTDCLYSFPVSLLSFKGPFLSGLCFSTDIMCSGGEPGVHSNQTVTPSACQPSVKLAGGLEGRAASLLLLIRGRPQAPPRPLLPGVGSLGDGGYDASSRPHNAPLPPFPSPVCSSAPPSMPGLVLGAESDGDSHPPAARPAPRRTPVEGRSPAQAQAGPPGSGPRTAPPQRGRGGGPPGVHFC